MLEVKCPNCGMAESAIDVLETHNEELFFDFGDGYVNNVCYCHGCHATFWANIDFKIEIKSISYEMIEIEEPEDETEEGE